MKRNYVFGALILFSCCTCIAGEPALELDSASDFADSDIADSLIAGSAVAKNKLELGLGFGFQYLPDYRGSDRYRALSIPFPIFRYRGKFIRADEEGLRAEVALTDRLILNVSADAALTVDADDNNLREGMPGLRPAFEIGPSLNIRLSANPASRRWVLSFPIRTVAGIDFSKAEHIGLVFNPQLVFRYARQPSTWHYQLRLGLLFADDDYHDYYYSVAQQYATPQRGEFDAAGGYSGAVVKLSLRRRVGQWWFGATLRNDYLGGAKFKASPLLERDNSFAVSAALGWFTR